MVALSQTPAMTLPDTVRWSARKQWLQKLDSAMANSGMPSDRMHRWNRALEAFLVRFRSRPQLVRPCQVSAYIAELAASGRADTRFLMDLVQVLAFFYDSVLPHLELAGVAGHPFLSPAEDDSEEATLRSDWMPAAA